MGRIIGIDFGTKRIGLAVTDPMQIIASPLDTVENREFDNYISLYLKKEKVEAFVIGYPVQMNNQASESVRFVNTFIKKLKKNYPDIEIHLIDERFTSQMAMRSMIEGRMKKKDRKDKSNVDKISASLILQSYLARKSNINENNIVK